jgi:hypothetical protein
MAVYFIAEEGTERVKIGTAWSIWPRMDQIQSKNQRQLILMRAIDGGVEEERRVQGHFRYLRLDGEWFTYCDEMWDFGQSIDVGPRYLNKQRKQRASFDA